LREAAVVGVGPEDYLAVGALELSGAAVVVEDRGRKVVMRAVGVSARSFIVADWSINEAAWMRLLG